MHTIKGTVSNISVDKASVDVMLVWDMRYKAKLLLDGQAVHIECSDMPVINDGDVITVSGNYKRGVFRAYAFKNETAGVSGGASRNRTYFRTALMFIVAAYCINSDVQKIRTGSDLDAYATFASVILATLALVAFGYVAKATHDAHAALDEFAK